MSLTQIKHAVRRLSLGRVFDRNECVVSQLYNYPYETS
jgi:hypothetical protein